MFQKVKVNYFREDSSESHYSKFLSNYAAQFVHKQLLLTHKVSSITVHGDCYLVETTERKKKVTTSSCECIFKSMLLPCWHIFALRSRLNQPLFDEGICNKRWSATYYQSTHRMFSEHSAASPTVTVVSAKHWQALSQHQKFHEVSLITTELASLVSTVSNIHYERRIELLKECQIFGKMGRRSG